jgi:serine/threonine-protein kinase TTK/MPS1
MAAASPTPMGQGSHFSSLGRRTSARQALRRPTSRPAIGRSGLNAIPDGGDNGVRAQSERRSAAHESSDDEIPVPMKLSALTKAILNGGAGSEGSSLAPSAADVHNSPPGSRRSSMVKARQRAGLDALVSSVADARGPEDTSMEDRQTRRHARTGSANGQPLVHGRLSSPVRSRDNSPAPRKRIVRLTAAAAATGGTAVSQNPLRRSLSTSTASQRSRRPPSRDRSDEQPESQAMSQPVLPSQQQQQRQESQGGTDLSTPAQPVRTVRIAVGSSGGNRMLSTGSSSGLSSKPSGTGPHNDHEQVDEPGNAARASALAGQGSVTRPGTVSRKDDGGPQSSMRIKRVGKLAGSFLSGPARRGRRRQSEEDGDDNEVPGSAVAAGAAVQSGPGAEQPQAMFESSFRDFAASGSPVSTKDALARKQSPYADIAGFRESIAPAHKVSVSKAPDLPSALDQENMPAPVIPKSFGGDALALLDKGPIKPFPRPAVADIAVNRLAAGSPERKVLAVKSQNTPHRPAPPPPPKMSVVETATKPAGAATTGQGAKKRTLLLKVNNVPYTRIDCLGGVVRQKSTRLRPRTARCTLSSVSLSIMPMSTPLRASKGRSICSRNSLAWIVSLDWLTLNSTWRRTCSVW